MKQAAESGPTGQRLASLLCFETNVHAIGLDQAQGLLVAAPFYWNSGPGPQAFARRMMAMNRGIAPTAIHAGVYSAVTHWLETAPGIDPADGRAVVSAMIARPATDPVMGQSELRADGSVAHAMTLFRVRAPGETAVPWDYYTPVRTIPNAFGTRAACVVP